MGTSSRVMVRRIVVIVVVALQFGFVVRAYWAPHREFGYQMFAEASEWQADIVRVTARGERIPITEPWSGYDWPELVGGRGLSTPWRRHHADSGIDRQLAFLGEALDWVAEHTPDDTDTRYLEAEVTTWHNMDPPTTRTMRSSLRAVP